MTWEATSRIVGSSRRQSTYPGIKVVGPFYDDFTASKDAATVDSARRRIRTLPRSFRRTRARPMPVPGA